MSGGLLKLPGCLCLELCVPSELKGDASYELCFRQNGKMPTTNCTTGELQRMKEQSRSISIPQAAQRNYMAEWGLTSNRGPVILRRKYFSKVIKQFRIIGD